MARRQHPLRLHDVIILLAQTSLLTAFLLPAFHADENSELGITTMLFVAGIVLIAHAILAAGVWVVRRWRIQDFAKKSR